MKPGRYLIEAQAPGHPWIPVQTMGIMCIETHQFPGQAEEAIKQAREVDPQLSLYDWPMRVRCAIPAEGIEEHYRADPQSPDMEQSLCERTGRLLPWDLAQRRYFPGAPALEEPAPKKRRRRKKVEAS